MLKTVSLALADRQEDRTEKTVKELKFTLYEVFGYLLPGSVTLVALFLIFWAIYMPRRVIQIGLINVQAFAAGALIAYLLGHLSQAIGNIAPGSFCHFEKEALREDGPDSAANQFVKEAKIGVAKLCNVDKKTISADWLYRVLDETVVQFGVGSEREIYQYREGFYRGCTVAFAVLAGGLLVRCIVPSTAVELRNVVHYLSRWVLVFPLLISISATWLSYRRFRRFGEYRVTRALLAFLLLSKNKTLQRMGAGGAGPTEEK